MQHMPIPQGGRSSPESNPFRWSRRARSRWPALLAIAALGCAGTRPSSEADGPDDVLVAQHPCGSPALAVRLPAPEPNGPTANFQVERQGTGMHTDQRATCLIVGSDRTLVPAGREAEVTMAAHLTTLQRLSVGHRDMLIWVAPGSELALGDDACFGVALAAQWLDPFGAVAPNAMCREPDSECPDGWVQVGPPGPVEDPLCVVHGNDSERRCVKMAQVRTSGVALQTAGTEPTVFGPSYTNVAPWIRACAAGSVSSPRDEVGLAIQYGARWTLHEDESGRLGGEQDANGNASPL